MNADSLLFVHTNNHGSTTGLCVDNSAVVTPTEWSTMLDGMKSFGTLVVTPVGCGSLIYLTKAPSLADILRAILERYLLVERLIVKHPIPDPPPDWSAKLLESLDLADALAQRFAAIDGRAVGNLIEESLKNAADIAKAGRAPATQRAAAAGKKAGTARGRRR
jgi:hypothetical protein